MCVCVCVWGGGGGGGGGEVSKVNKRTEELIQSESHQVLLARNLALKGKKGKRKVYGVPQSHAAALPRHQEEEETDK